MSASADATSAPSVTLLLHIDNGKSGETYYAGAEPNEALVASTGFRGIDASNAEIVINFRQPNSMTVGTHTGDLTVVACYDAVCSRHLASSPSRVPVTYTVTAAPPPPGSIAEPETGATALAPLTRSALAHDVIDAEYSAALNAVVMVSSAPAAMLFVYDVASGTERSVPLGRAPTAVSIGPDGHFAAVGHDAALTYVDLRTVGVVGAATPRQIPVSANVFDVVLAGNGFAYAFPLVDQWVRIHSIELATGTETLSASSVREHTRVRLQPNTNAIYGAQNGIYPDDIEKYSIADGPARWLYDSRYHGDYPICGDLWFNLDGSLIYTACGTLLRTAAAQTDDIVYAGRLQFSPVPSQTVKAIAMSVHPGTSETLLLTEPFNSCDRAPAPKLCWTHLEAFAGGALTNPAVRSLPPIDVAGIAYPQRGLFVFHADGGATGVLLSHASGSPDAQQKYFLSRF